MKKILLIVDDQDLSRSYQVALENQGFSIYTASNGLEGFETLQNVVPDLMVLDVIMNTNLEGHQLLQKIKKDNQYHNLPVILLAGMPDQIGEKLHSGLDDESMFPNVHFRDKPVDPLSLGILIHKILEAV